VARPKHPRDAFITVYGRKPVLEALTTPGIVVDKLLVATRARGDVIDAITDAARRIGIEPRRVDPSDVTRVSRNRKQDQGVVADVVAPRMDALTTYLAGDERPTREHLLFLDGLTTPTNVGMVIRSATAAGLTGIVVPRAGCPEVGPLVVKGSAGVAFRARILRTPTTDEGLGVLASAGFTLYGLDASGDADLYATSFADRAAIVLGNETSGLSVAAERRLDRRIKIPLAQGVESLNAAVAGSLVAFELARRRGFDKTPP
jgi:23S rRNA (guanosine2251-2'-O)-methyltransferase